MGASRVVFHTGAVTGRDREEALRLTMDEIETVLRDTSDDRGILLCPETMGKQNQQGTLDEILRICSIDSSRLLPTVDFGHVNALTQGALRSYDDYRRIIDAIGEALGERAARSFHIHFSHIEFGKSGEVRHLTFDDTKFGPFFEPLAEVLAERALSPVVICESRDVMAADALRMQTIFEEMRANPPLHTG
jgi:deoxyribonuclease-4